MACKEQMDALVSYAAGGLSASSKEALECHLAGCEDCRRTLDAQKALWSALDGYAAPPPSDNFDRRLYSRIAGETGRPYHVSIGALVTAACVALFAIFLFQAPVQESVRPVAVEQKINVEQVERTLDDLDMLKQLTVYPADQRQAPNPESQS